VRVFETRAAAAREISLAENLIREAMLGHVARTVLFGSMRGGPTVALTQRAGGGRPVPRIAQRCLILQVEARMSMIAARLPCETR
jgi:hypothetical protein